MFGKFNKELVFRIEESYFLMLKNTHKQVKSYSNSMIKKLLALNMLTQQTCPTNKIKLEFFRQEKNDVGQKLG